MSEGSEKFKLTDEGSVEKCLGVDITAREDGTCELKQMFLTKRIVEELNLPAVETQKRPTPFASPLLHEDLAGHERAKPWNFRLVIGMMTCPQGKTRPGMSMAAH